MTRTYNQDIYVQDIVVKTYPQDIYVYLQPKTYPQDIFINIYSPIRM